MICEIGILVLCFAGPVVVAVLPFRGAFMSSGFQLESYVDADLAHKATDRRPACGGVVMRAGACLSFFSIIMKKV